MNQGLQGKRYTILAIDSIILLLMGLIYAWSIFVNPLEAEFGWTRAQTSMTFSIGTGMTTVMALFSAILVKRFKPQLLTAAAGIMMLAGFWWAASAQSLWEMHLAYGVLCCCGIGVAYNQVLSTIVLWFQDKSGWVSGIVMMCYGVGSLVFGAVASKLIEWYGWRMTFRIAGVLCTAVLILGSAAVRRPTEEQAKQLPQRPNSKASNSSRNYSTGELLKDRSFWFFTARNLLMAATGLAVSGHASLIAQEAGVNATAAAFYVGAFSVLNGVGRVVFGILYDRMDQIKVMRIAVWVTLIGGIGLLTMFLIKSPIGIFPFFMLMGISFGSAPVTSTSFIKDRYGDANYGLNLSCANLCLVAASYIGPYFAGLLYQNFGYKAVLSSLIVYACAAGIVTILLGKTIARENAQ